MVLPDHPDRLLTRREAAAALTAAGYVTAPATLATRASRGGGPVYRHFGARVLYRWGDLIEWATARLGPPMRSTSERDAA
ncbi:MAG: DNA-binding protein [Stellaceae bacterium]